MNIYTLMPSLEHFALLKIAITLWKPQDVIRHLPQCVPFPDVWTVAEEDLAEKVKQLPLPEPLKKELLGFVIPTGIALFEFVGKDRLLTFSGGTDNFLRFKSLVRKILENLCWTPQGCIDKKKTAERLIRDEDLSITERYKLACINCIEEEISWLWNKLPEDSKYFFSEDYPRLPGQNELVVLWTYEIKGDVTRMHRRFVDHTYGSPYQYAFHYAVEEDNKAATEYFLQKLTSEERRMSLERYPYGLRDTIPYLLSQMNEVQQVGMCRKHGGSLLTILLEDWPLQSLFMEAAKHMWDSLPEGDYYYLLKRMITSVIIGFKGYDYQKLFREFWQQSPLTHKKYVLDKEIENSRQSSLLRHLFAVKDAENVKLILKDATVTEREKIIFSAEGKSICETLISDDEMDLLEFFVTECISSKDVMIKFRELFQEHLSKNALERGTDFWNKTLPLLDDITQKFDKKRCVEEESNGPAKRLCSSTSEQQSTSKKHV